LSEVIIDGVMDLPRYNSVLNMT